MPKYAALQDFCELYVTSCLILQCEATNEEEILDIFEQLGSPSHLGWIHVCSVLARNLTPS
jgi:hypothetical protein